MRVVIEKPFGATSEARRSTARPLGVRRAAGLPIDHYLGKETVQNIRSAVRQRDLRALWNRNYIDHVEITAAEDIGIGTRAEYYDHAGALRDIVQNHMLQLPRGAWSRR